MFIVHLVPPTQSLKAYAEAQRLLHGDTVEIVIADATDRIDSIRQARDAAVLARTSDVLAVVPHKLRKPTLPVFTNEWLNLADIAVVGRLLKNREVDEREPAQIIPFPIRLAPSEGEARAQ